MQHATAMRSTHQHAAAPVRHAATARITQQQAAAAAAGGGRAHQAAASGGFTRLQRAAGGAGQQEPRAYGEGGHGGDAAWREKLEERFRAEVHYLFARISNTGRWGRKNLVEDG